IQFVGIIVGTFSSIFFATPLLVTLKEKWGPVAVHTKKVLAKRAEAANRVGRAELVTAGAGTDASAPVTPRVGSRPTGKRAKKRR
ncbi:MAG: protein translocase subunit SecF, partial [Rhodococcus sp. (in: high G+C Gram-positive bacteria)]